MSSAEETLRLDGFSRGGGRPEPAGPVTELDDEALAAAAGRSSRPAFAELFARYRERIRQFVGWQLRGMETHLDDVTQEVFLEALRSLPRFRGECRFRTWLYALARNVCRQAWRRHRRGGSSPAADSEAGLEALPDLTPSALDRIEEQERRQRLARAVADLPPAQRTVLLLRDWEEMSYREIASVLELPLGTVRSRLFYARLAVADTLRSEERETDDAV